MNVKSFTQKYQTFTQTSAGHKKEKNLQDLISRSDPYNIKEDLINKQKFGYQKCTKSSCDSCYNFVDQTSDVVCKATGRKFMIRRDSTCTSKNVIYVAYCKTCGKQGVGSTVSWKPRLSNYKSHIKKEIGTCRIVKHFINECGGNKVNYIRFIIVDVLNNIENLSKEEIDKMLLQKEKFWIGTLITQHKGLNGTHDWTRTNRSEREKDC